MITLYHHPFSRAANVVWMLEELGLSLDVDYELAFVDIRAADQQRPELEALNPMSKIPTLVEGQAVVTETAAIALYLADRHSPGELAPALDDPARGPYLRWILFGPSVIEPAAVAQAQGWTADPGSVGWGGYQDMVAATEAAITPGPWILGERFSMADVCLGATVRALLQLGLLPQKPHFVDYSARLAARPAAQRADQINQGVVRERL